ncbi:MAG: hypothetical protein R3E91_00065 [Chlamydiales bacterium]
MESSFHSAQHSSRHPRVDNFLRELDASTHLVENRARRLVSRIGYQILRKTVSLTEKVAHNIFLGIKAIGKQTARVGRLTGRNVKVLFVDMPISVKRYFFPSKAAQNQHLIQTCKNALQTSTFSSEMILGSEPKLHTHEEVILLMNELLIHPWKENQDPEIQKILESIQHIAYHDLPKNELSTIKTKLKQSVSRFIEDDKGKQDQKIKPRKIKNPIPLAFCYLVESFLKAFETRDETAEALSVEEIRSNPACLFIYPHLFLKDEIDSYLSQISDKKLHNQLRKESSNVKLRVLEEQHKQEKTLLEVLSKYAQLQSFYKGCPNNEDIELFINKKLDEEERYFSYGKKEKEFIKWKHLKAKEKFDEAKEGFDKTLLMLQINSWQEHLDDYKKARFNFKKIQKSEEAIKEQFIDIWEKGGEEIGKLLIGRLYDLLGKLDKKVDKHKLDKKVDKQLSEKLIKIASDLPDFDDSSDDELITCFKNLMSNIHQAELSILSQNPQSIDSDYREKIDRNISEYKAIEDSLGYLVVGDFETFHQLTTYEERKEKHKHRYAEKVFYMALETKPQCQTPLQLAKKDSFSINLPINQDLSIGDRGVLSEIQKAAKQFADHLSSNQLSKIEKFIALDPIEKGIISLPFNDNTHSMNKKEKERPKLDLKNLAELLDVSNALSTWHQTIVQIWITHLPRDQEEALQGISDKKIRQEKMADFFRSWFQIKTGYQINTVSISFKNLSLPKGNNEIREQGLKKARLAFNRYHRTEIPILKELPNPSDKKEKAIKKDERKRETVLSYYRKSIGEQLRKQKDAANKIHADSFQQEVLAPHGTNWLGKTVYKIDSEFIQMEKVENRKIVNLIEDLTQIRKDLSDYCDNDLDSLEYKVGWIQQLDAYANIHGYPSSLRSIFLADTQEVLEIFWKSNTSPPDDIKQIFLNLYSKTIDNQKTLYLQEMHNEERATFLKYWLMIKYFSLPNRCSEEAAYRLKQVCRHSNLNLDDQKLLFNRLANTIKNNDLDLDQADDNTRTFYEDLKNLSEALQDSPIELEGLDGELIRASFKLDTNNHKLPETPETRQKLDALMAQGVDKLAFDLIDYPLVNLKADHYQQREQIARILNHAYLWNEDQTLEYLSNKIEAIENNDDECNPETLAPPLKIFYQDILQKWNPNFDTRKAILRFNQSLIEGNEIHRLLMGHARSIIFNTNEILKNSNKKQTALDFLVSKMLYQHIKFNYFEGKEEIHGFLKSACDEAEASLVASDKILIATLKNIDSKEIANFLEEEKNKADTASQRLLKNGVFNGVRGDIQYNNTDDPRFKDLGHDLTLDILSGIVYKNGEQTLNLPPNLQNHPTVRTLGIEYFPYRWDQATKSYVYFSSKGDPLIIVRETEDRTPLVYKDMSTSFSNKNSHNKTLQFVPREEITAPISLLYRMKIQHFWMDNERTLFGYGKDGNLIAKTKFQNGLPHEIYIEGFTEQFQPIDPENGLLGPDCSHRLDEIDRQEANLEERLLENFSPEEILVSSNKDKYLIPAAGLTIYLDKINDHWSCERPGMTTKVLEVGVERSNLPLMLKNPISKTQFKQKELEIKKAEYLDKVAQNKDGSHLSHYHAKKRREEIHRLKKELMDLQETTFLVPLPDRAYEEVKHNIEPYDDAPEKIVTKAEYSYKDLMGKLSYYRTEIDRYIFRNNLSSAAKTLEQYQEIEKSLSVQCDHSTEIVFYKAGANSSPLVEDFTGALLITLKEIEKKDPISVHYMIKELSRHYTQANLTQTQLTLIEEIQKLIDETIEDARQKASNSDHVASMIENNQKQKNSAEINVQAEQEMLDYLGGYDQALGKLNDFYEGDQYLKNHQLSSKECKNMLNEYTQFKIYLHLIEYQHYNHQLCKTSSHPAQLVEKFIQPLDTSIEQIEKCLHILDKSYPIWKELEELYQSTILFFLTNNSKPSPQSDQASQDQNNLKILQGFFVRINEVFNNKEIEEEAPVVFSDQEIEEEAPAASLSKSEAIKTIVALATKTPLEQIFSTEKIEGKLKNLKKEISQSQKSLIQESRKIIYDQVRGYYLESIGVFNCDALLADYQTNSQGEALYGLKKEDIRTIFNKLVELNIIQPTRDPVDNYYRVASLDRLGKDFPRDELRSLLVQCLKTEKETTQAIQRLHVFLSRAAQSGFEFAFKKGAEKEISAQLKEKYKKDLQHYLEAKAVLKAELRPGQSMGDLKYAYITNDFSKFSVQEGEKPGTQSRLKQTLTHYLIYKTECQHVKNIFAAPLKGERNKFQLLQTKRNYSVDLLSEENLEGEKLLEQIIQRTFLVFEGQYGNRCNMMQARIFRALMLGKKDPEGIDAIQARMGFGKTALLPLLSIAQVAKERNLPKEERHLVRYVVPRAVLEDNAKSFNHQIQGILGSHVIKDTEFLRYQIDAKNPKKSFHWILEDLKTRYAFYEKVRNNGDVLIQPPETRCALEAQEIEFSKILLNDEYSDADNLRFEAKTWLSKIRSLSSYTIFDELDDTQDIRSREVNFTRGEKVPIREAIVIPLAELTDYIQKNKNKDWTKKKERASELIDHMLNPNSLPDFKTGLIDYLIDPKVKYSPEHFNWDKDCVSHDDRWNITIFLIRMLLLDSYMLSIITTKKANTEFGARFVINPATGAREYSYDADSKASLLISVPYEGANNPKGNSIFDNTEVAAITTLLYYNSLETSFAINPHLDFLISQIQQNAALPFCENYLGKDTADKVIKELKLLSKNLDIDDLNRSKEKFYNEFMAQPTLKFRQFFGALVVAKQVRADQGCAKSNRYEQGSPNDLIVGCSGTVGGTSSYFEKQAPDPAADGLLTFDIMGRENNQEVKWFPPPDSNNYLKSTIEHLLNCCESSTRAIADSAGICKSRDGTPETVVQELWQQIQNKREIFNGIEGIIYYGKDNIKRLYRGPNKLAIPCTTDMEIAALSSKKYFTFYKQKNCRGSDVKQAMGIHCLVTIDENVTNSDAKQTILRLRNIVNPASEQRFSFAGTEQFRNIVKKRLENEVLISINETNKQLTCLQKKLDDRRRNQKKEVSEPIIALQTEHEKLNKKLNRIRSIKPPFKIEAKEIARYLCLCEKDIEIEQSLIIFKKEMNAHFKTAAGYLESRILKLFFSQNGVGNTHIRDSYKMFLKRRNKLQSLIDESQKELYGKYGQAMKSMSRDEFVETIEEEITLNIQEIFNAYRALKRRYYREENKDVEFEEENEYINHYSTNRIAHSINQFKKVYPENRKVEILDTNSQVQAQAQAQVEAQAQAEAEAEACTETLAQAEVHSQPGLPRLDLQMAKEKSVEVDDSFLDEKNWRRLSECKELKHMIARLFRNGNQQLYKPPLFYLSQGVVNDGAYSHFIFHSNPDPDQDEVRRYCLITFEEAEIAKKAKPEQLIDIRKNKPDDILDSTWGQIRGLALANADQIPEPSQFPNTAALRNCYEISNVLPEDLLPTLTYEIVPPEPQLNLFTPNEHFGVTKDYQYEISIASIGENVQIKISGGDGLDSNLSFPRNNYYINQAIQAIEDDDFPYPWVDSSKALSINAHLLGKQQELHTMHTELTNQETKISEIQRGMINRIRNTKSFSLSERMIEGLNRRRTSMDDSDLTARYKWNLQMDISNLDLASQSNYMTAYRDMIRYAITVFQEINRDLANFAADPTLANNLEINFSKLGNPRKWQSKTPDEFKNKILVSKEDMRSILTNAKKQLDNNMPIENYPEPKLLDFIYGMILHIVHGNNLDTASSCTVDDCNNLFNSTLPGAAQNLENTLHLIAEVKKSQEEIRQTQENILVLEKQIRDLEKSIEISKTIMEYNVEIFRDLKGKGILYKDIEFLNQFPFLPFINNDLQQTIKIKAKTPKYRKLVEGDMPNHKVAFKAFTEDEAKCHQKSVEFLKHVLDLSAKLDKRKSEIKKGEIKKKQ